MIADRRWPLKSLQVYNNLLLIYEDYEDNSSDKQSNANDLVIKFSIPGDSLNKN